MGSVGGRAKLSILDPWKSFENREPFGTYNFLFDTKTNAIRAQLWREQRGPIFRAHLAHHPSISQERILAQVRKGSASVASVGFPGQETLWSIDPELYGHLQPDSLARSGRW